MPIAFSCVCGQGFRVAQSAAGKRSKCPKCGQPLVIPQPAEEETSTFSVEDENPSPPPPTRAEREPTPLVPKRKPAVDPSEVLKKPAKLKQWAPSSPKAIERAEDRYRHLTPQKSSTNLLEYVYWLLLLAFIPLAWHLLLSEKQDTEERFMRTLEKAFPPPPEKAAKAPPAKEDKMASKQKLGRTDKKTGKVIYEEPDAPQINLDDLFALMPEGRIDGAFLPRKTFIHWVFALVAAIAFLGIAMILIPRAGPPLHLLWIGLFTATIGIVFLLVAQFLAIWTSGHFLISRNIVIMFLFWIAWAIGFSYRAAMDPDMSLIPSFFGFTFGVGFCEEVCKVLPVLWCYRVRGALPWRVACAWGFASGVGFGISEGIIYSADFYNGIASAQLYVVRFVSCVALHGIWSASAALFIHRHEDIIRAEFTWYEYVPRCLFLVSVPMVLHGLYDTFLKRELNGAALLVALVSFGWFAWSLERTRGREESPEMA